MSFIESLDLTTKDKLAEILGSGILSTLCTLTTKYVNGKNEFSGTGLVVSDGAKKYVFTANHVLEPSKRIPPRSGDVELSYHSIGLQKDAPPSQSYALRRKYCRSINHDLALVESGISERLDVDSRVDYYPVQLLKEPLASDPYLEDLFVVCGFPAEKKLEIVSAREVKHSLLLHCFSGKHGRNDPDRNTCFRIQFDGSNVSPSGMSGSPVWLIRQKNQMNLPILTQDVSRLIHSGAELGVQFIGLVVQYHVDSGEISAVKSEICAEFVKHAQGMLPTLRTAEEDAWINQQLEPSYGSDDSA